MSNQSKLSNHSVPAPVLPASKERWPLDPRLGLPTIEERIARLEIAVVELQEQLSVLMTERTFEKEGWK